MCCVYICEFVCVCRYNYGLREHICIVYICVCVCVCAFVCLRVLVRPNPKRKGLVSCTGTACSSGSHIHL